MMMMYDDREGETRVGIDLKGQVVRSLRSGAPHTQREKHSQERGGESDSVLTLLLLSCKQLRFFFLS